MLDIVYFDHRCETLKMLPGIGVFGTDTLVKCLVPILKSCGFKVEALWGRTKEQADEVAKYLDIGFSTNKIEEVLLRKSVDLVFIHCPPHLQSPIAVKALGIGKHVICGTPSGPSSTDALKMVKAAEYYPKLMSLMCNGLRFLPCFIKMRQLIEDGYVGNVLLCEAKIHSGSLLKDKFDWMCDELMGGGVLNIYGSVFIDIVTFLTGQRAVKVHGVLKTFTKQTDKIKGIRQITSDDFCSFQMELDGGASVTVTINSHLSGTFVHELWVCGDKGRLIVKGADLFGQKNDSLREEVVHRDALNILDEEKTGVSETIRADIPIPHLKGLMKLIDSVKDAFKSVEDKHGWVKGPVTVAATFEDALYVQTVVDAIRLSSKNLQWTPISIPSNDIDPNPALDSIRRISFPQFR